MKKLAAIIISLSVLMGCSKKTITTTYNIPGSIVMGQSSGLIATTPQDSNITHGGFQPASILSLDVNADGQADFNFSLENQYNMGGLHLYTSKMDMSSLNNDSFVLVQNAYSLFSYTVTYNQVTNHTDTTGVVRNEISKLNPKVLMHGSSVSVNDNWQHGTFNLSSYIDNRYNYTETTEYDGSWSHADGWYIGIKFQNRMGWIKITTNGYSIHLHEFALMKSWL